MKNHILILIGTLIFSYLINAFNPNDWMMAEIHTRTGFVLLFVIMQVAQGFAIFK